MPLDFSGLTEPDSAIEPSATEPSENLSVRLYEAQTHRKTDRGRRWLGGFVVFGYIFGCGGGVYFGAKTGDYTALSAWSGVMGFLAGYVIRGVFKTPKESDDGNSP